MGYNFNTSSLNQNKINNDSKQPIQSIQMNASIKAPLNDVINKAQIVRHPSYNSHKSQSMTSAVLGSEYSFSNDLNPDSTLQSIPIELQDRTNQVVTVKEVHPSYDEEFTEGSGDLNFLKQCLKCCRKNCCTLNTVMQKVYFISVITFIYLMIGGLVFSSIEKPQELQVCKDSLDNLKQNFPIYINRIHYNHSVRAFENLTREITSLVQNGIQFHPRYNISGNDTWEFEIDCPNDWNFISSVFFSSTVITTIGYGERSPKTNSGQIFCIFYF